MRELGAEVIYLQQTAFAMSVLAFLMAESGAVTEAGKDGLLVIGTIGVILFLMFVFVELVYRFFR